MNLDEMKNSWNVLNERLEQNEILNKRIIEEMVASKTKSAMIVFIIRNYEDFISSCSSP